MIYSTVLIRIEILIFLISIWYSLYYIGDLFYGSRVKRIKKQQDRIQKRKEMSEKKATEKQDETPTAQHNGLSPQQIEQLREILGRAQVNKSRGYYDTARNLIVEWLAIDKNNRELNLELAEVYELEKKYKNAEYIYNDILEIHPDNVEVRKKLWNILAFQWELQKSAASYEVAHSKKKDDIEIVDILAGTYFELKNFKKCLVYAKLFLKDKPRDVEKLGMKWYCLEKHSDYQWAISCYHKILETQPYNSEIKERIEKLEKKK